MFINYIRHPQKRYVFNMNFFQKSIAVFSVAMAMTACGGGDSQPSKNAEPIRVAGIVVPSPVGAVNDFEGIISAEREAQLNDSLKVFKENTGHELVVVTLDTIPADKNPVWFTTEIGNHWGVGEADKNNGLLMLISEDMAQIGIASGKGVETLYTDSVCDFVIKKMIPYLSVGDYDGGVIKATHLFEDVAAAKKP